jgi:hypothetical protein
MVHLPFSKSIGREWLLSQVLDGHGYYEVIAANIGYVTRLGDESERLEKILEGFAFHIVFSHKGI